MVKKTPRIFPRDISSMTLIEQFVFVTPIDCRRKECMSKPHINVLSQTRYPSFELQ